MIEDEMVGWHHRLNGHEFEQSLRAGDGQGSLACCSPCGHKESEGLEVKVFSSVTFHMHQGLAFMVYHRILNIVPWAIQSVQFSCSVVSDSL